MLEPAPYRAFWEKLLSDFCSGKRNTILEDHRKTCICLAWGGQRVASQTKNYGYLAEMSYSSRRQPTALSKYDSLL